MLGAFLYKCMPLLSVDLAGRLNYKVLTTSKTITGTPEAFGSLCRTPQSCAPALLAARKPAHAGAPRSPPRNYTCARHVDSAEVTICVLPCASTLFCMSLQALLRLPCKVADRPGSFCRMPHHVVSLSPYCRSWCSYEYTKAALAALTVQGRAACWQCLVCAPPQRPR